MSDQDSQDLVDNYLERLHARAKRAFENTPIETLWNSRRAIVGPTNWPAGERYDRAEQAKALLTQGLRPSAAQLAALEVAIRLLRPAPLSRQTRLDDLPNDAASIFTRWDGFRHKVAPYLYSVGRLDSLGKGVGGTGFVVGEDLIATNRHVLEFLSRGTMGLERGQAVIRFREEYNSPTEDPVDVVGVRAVHPDADLALLELAPGSTAARPPLQYAEDPLPAGEDIVALGYPMDDPIRNPLFITAVFGSRFGVKRGAPGEVIGTRNGVIYHDCSTLGGNSGSPVVSLTTGHVVGVHSSGYFAYRNAAILVEELTGFLRAGGVS